MQGFRKMSEFPTGYHGCCGKARARGHWDLCPHSQASHPHKETDQ